MERLIESGVVTVNGKTAALGERVTAADAVRVEGRLVHRRSLEEKTRAFSCTTRWRARSSPVTTPRAVPRYSTTSSRASPGARWVAVGRLDFNTEGLLLFYDLGVPRQPLDAPPLGDRTRIRCARDRRT